MRTSEIWRPVAVSPGWREVRTDRFDSVLPAWRHRRLELIRYPDQYARFIDQLKRKQAIDTGIIERLYDLKRGITETFVREGFVDAYLQHGDTNIAPELLMAYLRDQFDAIDFIFNYIKADYQAVLQVLQQKLSEQRSAAPEQDDIGARMHAVHDQVNRHLAAVVADLKQQLHADVARTACPPDHAQAHFYLRQLIDYAKQHRYYLNTALPRSWLRLIIDLGQARVYRLVISLHHYGHGGRTFALGAFLSLTLASGKTPDQTGAGRSDRYLDIPLAIPPLILAADAERSDLERVLDRQIDQILTAALAVIANAL